MMKEKYVCCICGSEDIEQRAWIDVNTGMLIEKSQENGPGDIYCTCCHRETAAERKSEYSERCRSILTQESEERDVITKMLESILNAAPGSHTLYELIEAADDETVCEIKRRVDFIQEIKLAYEQHLCLNERKEPQEMNLITSDGIYRTVRLNQHLKSDHLTRVIPNRRAEYRSVNSFLEELSDLNKKLMMTVFVDIRDFELPF